MNSNKKNNLGVRPVASHQRDQPLVATSESPVSARTALMDARAIPKHFVACLTTAIELRDRGWHPVLIVERGFQSWQIDLVNEFGLGEHLLQLSTLRLSWQARLRMLLGVIRAWNLILSSDGEIAFSRFIRDYRYQGIQLGDLIFDQHVRKGAFRSPLSHPFCLTGVLLTVLRRAERLLSIPGKHGIISVSTYVYGGIPGILSRLNSGKRGEKTGVFLYTEARDITGTQIFVNPKMMQFVADNMGNSALVETAIRSFEETSAGKGKYLDAARAYGSHVEFKKLSARRQTNAGSPDPVLLVASHCFSDAVHGAGPLVFRDYVDWVKKTLDWIEKRQPRAYFIFKEHPSASDYGETGFLERIVRRKRLGDVEFVGGDVNTGTVLRHVDCVVTARGTIGLEATARGTPVVLAGSAPYGPLEIATEPTSANEYFENLGYAVLGKIAPPTEKQRFRATLALFYGENERDRGLEAYLGLSPGDISALASEGSNFRTRREDLEHIRLMAQSSSYREDMRCALDGIQVAG